MEPSAVVVTHARALTVSHVTRSLPTQVAWETVAAPCGKGEFVELVAELDPQVARSYHLLLMLLDAEGKSLAQGVRPRPSHRLRTLDHRQKSLKTSG